MFEFKTKTPCKLAGVNVRSELHGKEHVPAVDLKIVMNASNTILKMENPFFNADPLPLDGDDNVTPLFPQTPEDALIASVG